MITEGWHDESNLPGWSTNGFFVPHRNNKTFKEAHKRHIARPLQLPRDKLALTVQRCRQEAGLSITRLADRSGIDVAHLWRIEQSEHQNVSREILILLSIALIVDTVAVDRIVEVANEILDAAGFKLLRTPSESYSHSPGTTHLGRNPEKRLE